MRKRILTIVCVIGFAAALGAGPAAAETRYVEGEVIVTFKPSASLDAARRNVRAHALTMARHFPELSRHRGRQTSLVRGPGETTEALTRLLTSDPSVETVEPNYLRWANATTTNDTFFPQLWALQNTGQTVSGVAGTAGDDIAFRQAWNMARPSTGEVVVAVIDTGVDYGHPDLVGNMWTNRAEIPGNGRDDDANGFVDDSFGYDFSSGGGNPFDSGSHGTHVAGTIAAVGNNALGVIGVAYNARIMALRVSGDGSTMSTASIIAALEYVTMMKKRGIDIVAINSSYGGGGYSTSERAAILAAGEAGVILCAAAGNDGADNDAASFYPASYRLSNMIVVAATDSTDTLATFSNYGATSVDLAAPGVNIYSTSPGSLGFTTAEVREGGATYAASGFAYAGVTTGITAVIRDCGLGSATEFPADVSNNIALIHRGTLFFSEKVSHAMAAGARAVIIDNNVSGSFVGTLQFASNWIPAVSISLEDGNSLRAALPAPGTVVNDVAAGDHYAFKSGTSMATPHVAGAVAFAAMNFPAESVAQRIHRVLTAVDPREALSGKVATGGRLNLLRTVDVNTNTVPDWWEQSYLGKLGTDLNADTDHDGMSGYEEFIAGTDPRDPKSNLHAAPPDAGTNGVRVTWTSVPGKSYRVWSRNDWTSGWFVAQSNVAAAAASATTWLDTNAPALSRRYYHIEVLPAE